MLALAAANFAMGVSGLILSKSFLSISPPWRPLVGILLASALAGALVWLLPERGLSSIEGLVLDSTLYLFAYLTIVPLLLGVDKDDLIRLGIATGTLGPLAKPLALILSYEKRILTLRHGRKPTG
jgi:hypothetical protein